MKFRAERTEFEEAIKWVQRTVGERVSFPAMAGIKLSLAGDELTLSSTNGQIDSELTLPVQGERDGGALVSGKLLSNVVHLLPNDAVEIAAVNEAMNIRCGRASFELRLMVLEDFPSMRTPLEDAPSATLQAGEFSQLITQVARSASTEDARAVLTGVKLEASDGNFTAAATDSYRLAVRTIPWDEAGEMSALVSRRALEQAKHAADMLGSAVKLVLEPSYATFVFADRRLVSTLVEGKYPEYRGLIPDGYERRIRVDRQALTEVVRRIAVVGEADKAMTPVILGMDSDTLTVKADSTEAGQAEESLPIELEGEPLQIAFNPRFLIDGLDAMGGEQVMFEFRDELKPAVMRPPAPEEGDDESDADYLYLLMPVRV
ncbi:DNA polymerase III beta subunit [Euzebya pacifica]|uniref:Beta sliding clamp n=1 Tax=Euzebya pacifica TaxID=1608957 RepID=A0A346XR66_9ACTN|nr:DNA polymerase III subunit beta [Euzebya pacifica]AXV04713.1 DNA polymerase III beta subunit [Euzebya pacifica]